MTAFDRVLAVFAHADDETLLSGALLARLASDGAEVRLVCAAPGDEASSERLDRACAALGVASVSSLRYSPSPMWPTGDSSAGGPRWEVKSGPRQEVVPMLAAAPPGELAARIEGRIDDFRPSLVVTHSSYGEYGHADHVHVHRATLAAFDSRPRPGSRLWTLAYPLPLVRLNLLAMRLTGHDPAHAGPEGNIDLGEAVRNALPKSFAVDVRDSVQLRRQAAAHYAPVIRSGPPHLRALEAMPVWAQRLIFRRAAVTEVRGPGAGRRR